MIVSRGGMRAALERGRKLYNAGRFEAAVLQFEAILRRAPGNSRAALCLAHALRSSRRLAEALQAADALVAASPRSAPARLCRGEILESAGKTARARGDYRAALRFSPNDPAAPARWAASEARLRKTEILRTQQDVRGLRLDAAFARAERLVEEGPSQYEFDKLIDPTETERCEPLAPSEAGRLIRGLSAYAARRPRDPWPHLVMTSLYSRIGQGRQALRASGHLVGLAPRHQWMRFVRGRALLLVRAAHGRAQVEFRAAAAAAPGLWKARAFLAEIAFCRGEKKSALLMFEDIIGGLSGPPRAEARVWRGLLLLWRGEYIGAVEDFEFGLSQGVSLALCWRGAARMRLGRTAAALRDLSAAIRANPGDAEALTWRGELLRVLGRQDLALRDLAAALAIRGGQFWAAANRALIRAEKGDLAGMASDYEDIPAVVRRIFRGQAGLSFRDKSNSSEIPLILRTGLEANRDIRRDEMHLFSLGAHGRALPWTR